MTSSTRPDLRTRRDRGVTLTELLVTIVITGAMMLAISSALLVVAKSAPRTTHRVRISKEMSFVQTWVPLDLSSATATDTSPSFPTTSTPMPGTNVLTISRADDGPLGGGEMLVSYRYVHSFTEWRLERYEIRGIGTAGERIDQIGVAHELAAPPATWTSDQAPVHAVDVRARNDASGGIDMILTFNGGETFTVGGSPLAVSERLPDGGDLGYVDPTAPPSRCGGTITLVLDTSGSVPKNFGGEPLKKAAVEFVDLFQGTPVRMNLIGFDNGAYPMYPAAAGTYVPMLNPSDQISAARTRVLALDNRDGTWNTGIGADKPEDWPTFDGIHWSQLGQGTNWEHGLHMPFFDEAGVEWPNTPDLVVFVTDGIPNQTMRGTRLRPAPAAAAKANLGRSTSARIIGVIVGDEADSASAVNTLKSVVGNVEFDATANQGMGNAATADFFRAEFVNTAQALREIMAAQCGGTITLQKRVEIGGVLQDVPRSSSWTFSSDIGVRVLDRSVTSSVTLDYAFGPGENTKSIRVVEDGTPPGFVFDRVECMKQGAPVAGRVSPAVADGGGKLPGADIVLNADEALSCLVISKPAP